jgi:hypothetical protein
MFIDVIVGLKFVQVQASMQFYSRVFFEDHMVIVFMIPVVVK